MGWQKNRGSGLNVMRSELLYPAIAILLLLSIWHLIAVGFQLSSTFLPTPVAAFRKVVFSYKTFLTHGLVTVYEILTGFVLSVVIGVFTALLMVWSRVIDKVVSPVLVFLQTVPYISVAPLLIIWFGFGLTPKIVVSFLMGYFPIVIATAAGMSAVDSEMVDLIRSMSASKWQIFWKGRLPHSLPYLFSGAKISVALATSGAIVGEYVGSDKGLGYLIVVANSDTNAELLFGTIIVVSAFGVSFFWLIRWIEQLSIPWYVAFRPEERSQTVTDA